MPRKHKVDKPGITTPVPGQAHGQRAAQEAQMAAAPPAQAPDVSALAKAMPFAPVGLGADPEGPEAGIPETAGLPFGPGPGPEALEVVRPEPAPAPNAGDMEAMRPLLAGLELIASMPGASATSRHLVRRMRAELKGR